MTVSSHRWALVLAAGSGTRLSGLTADGSGSSVPKQFCSLAGGASLLEETLQRAASIAPAAQTAVVVAADHRPFWSAALESVEARNVIVQPRNRGTANGILLGLSVIVARDADAIVAILPSDHYVENESVLARVLERAVASTEARAEHAITFLGIAPDVVDPELGYIVPAARATARTQRIVRFVEKPARPLAAKLVRERALWNSFILVARARALVELIERRFPAEVAAFRGAVAATPVAGAPPIDLERLYDSLPEIDFSRHVVEGADAELGVIAVPACGWSDLGTPQRVGDVLARRGKRPTVIDARAARPTRHFNLAEAYSRLVAGLEPAVARTA